MLSLLRRSAANLGSTMVGALVIVAVLAAPALAEWSSAANGSQRVTAGTLAAPTGTSAVNGTCVARTSWHVNISWTASASTFEDGYEILRSTATGGPYTSLGTVAGAGTTTFVDTTPTFATTYFYVVQAKRNLWRSPNSNEATVTTLKRNCN